MDNTREKLINLLSKCFPKNITILSYDDNFTVNIKQGNIADYLIANGVTVKQINKMTNAQKIRAMSDEELAEFISDCGCPNHSMDCMKSCKDCTLKWLKQPVEDE